MRTEKDDVTSHRAYREVQPYGDVKHEYRPKEPYTHDDLLRDRLRALSQILRISLGGFALPFVALFILPLFSNYSIDKCALNSLTITFGYISTSIIGALIGSSLIAQEAKNKKVRD